MKRSIEIEILFALAKKWEHDVTEEQKLCIAVDADDLKSNLLNSKSEGADAMKMQLAAELRALVDILA